LGDLWAGKAVGGHLRNAKLRRSEGVAADDATTTRPSTGRRQLDAGSFGEPDGPAAGRQVEAVAQGLPGRGALSGAAVGGAKLDQGSGVLEPG
jgi:hypothetical protein